MSQRPIKGTVQKILGHRADEDPYLWKFRVQWYSGERTEECLSYFLDGATSVVDMVIDYLKGRFGGAKKLLTENKDGKKVYSIMNRDEIREEVKAGTLKLVKDVFAASGPAAPMPLPACPEPMPVQVLPQIYPQNAGRKVEIVLEYKYMDQKDYFRFEREGIDAAVWEPLSKIGKTFQARCKIVDFLAEHHPDCKLMARRDDDGNVLEYIIRRDAA